MDKIMLDVYNLTMEIGKEERNRKLSDDLLALAQIVSSNRGERL